MPYIPLKDRFRLQNLNVAIESADLKTCGELNYAMYKLAQRYLELHGLRYQTCAEVDSAYSCGAKEFYEKVTTPYERRKEEENGEVEKMERTLRQYEKNHGRKWCPDE